MHAHRPGRLGLQHAADKGIVHRDIKPANLLVDKDGVVKVLDMGLARFKADEKDNLTAKYDRGAILGTAAYMAPEQVLESSKVDGRADIYSLGVTLYALINGKPPYSGTNTQKMAGHTSVQATSLTKIRRDIPKGLSAVVDKMMAKLPADRYQTPAEVVAALSPWLEADTIPVTSSLTGKLFPESAIRRRASKVKGIAVIVAVAVSALVFGGVGMWAFSGGSDTPPNRPLPRARRPEPTGREGDRRRPRIPAQPKVEAEGRCHAPALYEIDFESTVHRPVRAEAVMKLDGSFPKGWGSELAGERHLRGRPGGSRRAAAASIRRSRARVGGTLHFRTPPFQLTRGRTYTAGRLCDHRARRGLSSGSTANGRRSRRGRAPPRRAMADRRVHSSQPRPTTFQVYFSSGAGSTCAVLVRSFRITRRPRRSRRKEDGVRLTWQASDAAVGPGAGHGAGGFGKINVLPGSGRRRSRGSRQWPGTRP